MLADPAPEHGGRDIATPALGPGFVQDPQDDPFLPRKPVTHVRQEITLVLRKGGSQGLNSVFSFFFTATPLIVT